MHTSDHTPAEPVGKADALGCRPVLAQRQAILQVGLAEMGQVWVHVGVGVAYLLAAVSLFTLTARKPGVRTA